MDDPAVWPRLQFAFTIGMAILWWPLAMALSIGYGVYVFRQFRGKVRVGTPSCPAH